MLSDLNYSSITWPSIYVCTVVAYISVYDWYILFM